MLVLLIKQLLIKLKYSGDIKLIKWEENKMTNRIFGDDFRCINPYFTGICKTVFLEIDDILNNRRLIL